MSDWPEFPESHPLAELSKKLGSILESTGYNEMYGIELVAPSEGYVHRSQMQSNMLTRF